MQLLSLDKSKKYVVGYSTGVDSTVLLHYLKVNHYQVRAICVKHHLDNVFTQGISESIANTFCEKWLIPCRFISVNVSTKNGGFESNARAARYTAISNELAQDEVFLTAHHNDDVVETVFLQLLRGTGLKGLGGIKTEQVLQFNDKQIIIFRPLLKQSKQNIVQYAKNHDLIWYEDVTNHDSSIKRNDLRLNVLPDLKVKYSHLNKNITKLTEYIQEADRNLMDLAKIDIHSVQITDLPLITIWDRTNVKTLSKERISNLIRYFFKKKYNHILSETEYKEVFKRIFSVNSEMTLGKIVKLKINSKEIVFEKLIVC